MVLDGNAQVTLYYQLKEKIINKIKSKEWSINYKIPTERQLCDIYNVSRITVRQALDELENDGYLYRKQGRGTFVTAPKIEQRLSKFYSFSEEIAKMGYESSSNLLDFKLIQGDQTITTSLNVDKDSQIYSIRRLRLANIEPFAIETSFIPYSIASGLAAEDVAINGLYKTLQQKFDIIPDEAEETFEAVLIDVENADYLHVVKNSPGILLERFTYFNGRVVEFCRSLIRGDRYKYKVTLK